MPITPGIMKIGGVEIGVVPNLRADFEWRGGGGTSAESGLFAKYFRGKGLTDKPRSG